MPNNSYMPDKQADQRTWLASFTATINLNPSGYGLSVEQAASMEAANTALETAWAAAENPLTRTRGLVEAKRAALKSAILTARSLVGYIQANPMVSDQLKLDAGVTVRKTHPSTQPAPGQKPIVVKESLDGRLATIELRQAMDKRGKPANVKLAAVFIAHGDEAPLNANEWTFYANTGKTTMTIDFGASQTASKAWVTAFWINGKGQSGPAAAPLFIDLPAGGTLPREADQAPVRMAA